jgi:outer membrane biosynthesis protein TonB
MQRALKSFLDDLREEDNVVNLDHLAKNDNDEDKQEKPESMHGTASGMLDMRAMALKYQQMAASGRVARGTDVPDVHGLPAIQGSNQVLLPIAKDESQSRLRLLVALMGFGALALVALTVLVTTQVMKQTVEAPIATPVKAVAAELTPPAKTTTTQAVPVAPVAPAPQDGAFLASFMDEGEEVVEEESAESAEPTSQPEKIAVAETVNGKEEDEKKEKIDRSEKREKSKSESKARVAEVVAKSTSDAKEEAKEEAPVVEEEAAEEAIAQESNKEVAMDEPKAGCDEVLCLLEGKGCCGSMAKKAPAASAANDPNLPERLTSPDIKQGLRPIKGRLESCASRNGVVGVVTLKLKISPEGKLLSSNAPKAGEEFSSCATDVLSKAKFAKSQEGATLSYPLILR